MKKRDPPSIVMGVSFLYLFDWMSPPFITAIAIIFMSDRGTRGTVFGVPGGKFFELPEGHFLGYSFRYKRDIFWGIRGVFRDKRTFLGYPRALSLVIKSKI